MAHLLAKLVTKLSGGQKCGRIPKSWTQKLKHCQASSLNVMSSFHISFFIILDLIFNSKKYDCQQFQHITFLKGTEACLFFSIFNSNILGKKLTFGPFGHRLRSL